MAPAGLLAGHTKRGKTRRRWDGTTRDRIEAGNVRRRWGWWANCWLKSEGKRIINRGWTEILREVEVKTKGQDGDWSKEAIFWMVVVWFTLAPFKLETDWATLEKVPVNKFHAALNWLSCPHCLPFSFSFQVQLLLFQLKNKICANINQNHINKTVDAGIYCLNKLSNQDLNKNKTHILSLNLDRSPVDLWLLEIN